MADERIENLTPESEPNQELGTVSVDDAASIAPKLRFGAGSGQGRNGRRRHHGGPAGRMMRGEKAKDFKGTLRKLLHYLGAYKVAVVVVMFFAVGATVFNILGPKILGNATTTLFTGIMNQITGSGDGPDFGAIATILLTVLGLYAISAVLQFVQGFIMSKVANKLSYRLRQDIDEKIMRLPFAFYDTHSSGDVMSHITNDVDAIQQSFSTSVTQIITSTTTLIGIIVMMLTISWLMTLIAIVCLPLFVLVIVFIVSHSQKHFTRQQDYLGEVNGIVEENYGAHNIIKAFNAEGRTAAEFKYSNDELYKAGWKSMFLSSIMMPMLKLVSNIGYAASAVLGGWLAIQGSITVGDIQAFIQYMQQFQQPVTQVAQISNVLQQTMAAAERIFNFLAEPEGIPELPEAERADAALAPASVSFDHVRFGYTDDKVIIKDFSAKAEPGQKIAIVGPTGAGKTTMVKLLMRFYDVNSGSIKLGDHDLREYGRNDLRDQFGMVLQDTWLYNGSIADNIRYGKLDASDEEVRQAARVAQADHFISTLPEGYNLEINEEASNISQGQKQLLTIARAVLHDPKILILDEATSSVDTRTELLIQTAMDNLMRGRTSFIIAHRLSTIKNADLILVMSHGDIVEQGTHEGLLAKGGFYADLYNSQFDVIEEE
ncbi:MAG: ABC transporter ATP-binding protein/permease [Coriobacteriales bacterium]|jgi:ATP-binding cassette subfamily B protein|nr:ABC transporter ATP-binding protein/permease [Coriobacteriales bacterium]